MLKIYILSPNTWIFVHIGCDFSTDYEKRFGSPCMNFQLQLVQSTQKTCASPAVTVPMAKSGIFGPKRANSIFPKFSEISAKFCPLSRPFNPFGRRHEARGREIRRGFESSVQSSRWRVGAGI